MRLSGAVCLALAVAVAVAAAAVPAQARDVQPRRQLKQLDGQLLQAGKSPRWPRGRAMAERGVVSAPAPRENYDASLGVSTTGLAPAAAPPYAPAPQPAGPHPYSVEIDEGPFATEDPNFEVLRVFTENVEIIREASYLVHRPLPAAAPDASEGNAALSPVSAPGAEPSNETPSPGQMPDSAAAPVAAPQPTKDDFPWAFEAVMAGTMAARMRANEKATAEQAMAHAAAPAPSVVFLRNAHGYLVDKVNRLAQAFAPAAAPSPQPNSPIYLVKVVERTLDLEHPDIEHVEVFTEHVQLAGEAFITSASPAAAPDPSAGIAALSTAFAPGAEPSSESPNPDQMSDVNAAALAAAPSASITTTQPDIS